MTNEPTNKTDTDGKKDDKPNEDTDKPLSLYDKTEALVIRQEEANKKKEELLNREEKLHSDQRLAGTGGGHIEVKKLSQEEIDSNARVQKIGEMAGAQWAKPKEKQ